MFPLGQAHQASPEQRTSREVEGMKRFFLNESVSGGLLLGSGNARRSSNARGTVNCGAMTCTCRPSTTSKVVRRISWRRTISLMLRSRIATSHWRRQSERVKDIEKRYVGQRVLKLPQPFLRDGGRRPIFSGHADNG